VVTTKQVEDYMSKSLNLNLSKFFDQYLRDTRIPTLEYFVKDGNLTYRWSNCLRGFDMPVKVWIDGKERFLKATTRQQTERIETQTATVKVDPNFYVYSFNASGN
jgi:hypothetical protein